MRAVFVAVGVLERRPTFAGDFRFSTNTHARTSFRTRTPSACRPLTLRGFFLTPPPLSLFCGPLLRQGVAMEQETERWIGKQLQPSRFAVEPGAFGCRVLFAVPCGEDRSGSSPRYCYRQVRVK